MYIEFKNGDITLSKNNEHFLIVRRPSPNLNSYSLISLQQHIVLIQDYTIENLNSLLNGLKHSLYNRID